MDENNNIPGENDPAGTGEKNSNLAITIVIVVGILLGAILLFRSPSEDMASPTPGSGTPQIIQPMATPPTSTATVPPRPTNLPPTAIQPPAAQPTTVPATAVQPTIPPVQPSPIQGINWQWVNVTDQSNGQATTVPTPAQYTIVFTSGGYVNGTADCNNFTGTYSLSNGLAIKITTMTRAACPDGAGNLALETAGGAQRMLFQNGGPAQ